MTSWFNAVTYSFSAMLSCSLNAVMNYWFNAMNNFFMQQ